MAAGKQECWSGRLNGGWPCSSRGEAGRSLEELEPGNDVMRACVREMDLVSFSGKLREMTAELGEAERADRSLNSSFSSFLFFH